MTDADAETVVMLQLAASLPMDPRQRTLLETSANTINRLRAENARLREALGKVAGPRYGLTPTATDGEAHDYWKSTCYCYRRIARAALDKQEGEG